MVAIDTHELAWAAGFFDGEGNVYCQTHKGNRGNRQLKVRVTQTGVHATTLLERFKRAVLSLGNIHGPYPTFSTAKKRCNDHWDWEAGSFEGGQAVIAALWKFLGPAKRAQATAALQKYHSLARR